MDLCEIGSLQQGNMPERRMALTKCNYAQLDLKMNFYVHTSVPGYVERYWYRTTIITCQQFCILLRYRFVQLRTLQVTHILV